ncbi:hypothetical protein [Actinokineospora sp. NBRC 105648]|uniref:hypothetical protein n=1 Tax=Actinokineospora sp. NBRC 105648 TaxID=3032206 RepID=UPI0024A0D8FC|nr:hypothetical protein [Actinokineospora sp. NBRC 105648]GLZ38874.1 hypothetical protein Acsp05_24980 [Actinokineospora sp. NBRC 105648]
MTPPPTGPRAGAAPGVRARAALAAVRGTVHNGLRMAATALGHSPDRDALSAPCPQCGRDDTTVVYRLSRRSARFWCTACSAVVSTRDLGLLRPAPASPPPPPASTEPVSAPPALLAPPVLAWAKRAAARALTTDLDRAAYYQLHARFDRAVATARSTGRVPEALAGLDLEVLATLPPVSTVIGKLHDHCYRTDLVAAELLAPTLLAADSGLGRGDLLAASDRRGQVDETGRGSGDANVLTDTPLVTGSGATSPADGGTLTSPAATGAADRPTLSRTGTSPATLNPAAAVDRDTLSPADAVDRATLSSTGADDRAALSPAGTVEPATLSPLSADRPTLSPTGILDPATLSPTVAVDRPTLSPTGADNRDPRGPADPAPAPSAESIAAATTARIDHARRWLAGPGRDQCWPISRHAPTDRPPADAVREAGTRYLSGAPLTQDQARHLRTALFATDGGPKPQTLLSVFTNEEIATAITVYTENGTQPLRDKVIQTLDA